MKQFIFTAGLPGSGKTTYLEQNIEIEKSLFVSADKIKERIWEHKEKYGDTTHLDKDGFFESIHKLSTDQAEDEVKLLMNQGHERIVMDMGGINNSYTKRIIDAAHVNGYKCLALLFDTPVEVCLKRMSQRGRVVPAEDLYKKNQMLNKSFNGIIDMVEEYKFIHYFTNKYIFLDMDGTVCAYQKPPRDIDGNVDFVNSRMFANPHPVPHIIEWVKNNFEPDKIHILGASPNSICTEDKRKWIERNMPFIDSNNVYFCGNKDYKHVTLKQLMIKLKMQPKDVLMIDDNYQIINNGDYIHLYTTNAIKYIIYK